jgi:hypothetical protein
MSEVRSQYSPEIVPRLHIYVLIASLLLGMIILSFSTNL